MLSGVKENSAVKTSAICWLAILQCLQMDAIRGAVILWDTGGSGKCDMKRVCCFQVLAKGFWLGLDLQAQSNDVMSVTIVSLSNDVLLAKDCHFFSTLYKRSITTDPKTILVISASMWNYYGFKFKNVIKKAALLYLQIHKIKYKLKVPILLQSKALSKSQDHFFCL